MKNFYSIVGSFLIIGSAFAQGVNSNYKMAQKKIIDTTLPKVIQASLELRSAAVDCDSEFYCENFEGVDAPALPADMNTTSLENNYYVPTESGNVQVSGFFTGNSQDAGAGGYWTYLDDHTTFAMTNDDSCLPGGVAPNEANNCDLSFEVLELPEFDFTGQSNMWILFEFYHDKNWGGGDASVEISVDSGATWEELSDGPLPETQAWQAAAFDLSDYSDSSSVTIRFLWSDAGSWASGFAVDDIVINPLPEYAIKLNQALQVFPSSYFGGTSYPTVPKSQAEATAYNFAGYIQNMGLNTLDSARVYASITSEGFSSQSDGINTVSLDQDSLFCNDVFTATSAGTYTADIYAADENGTQTETSSVSFEVTEFEYARDDAGMSGDYSGGSFVNDAGSEQRGNVFDIYADATIYAIKVRAHPATSPSCMVKGIINTVIPGDGTEANPTTYAFFTETPEINIGEYTDGWTNLMFNPPVQVFAGDVILATISAAYNGVDTLVIGTSGNTDVAETMLQDIDGTQPNGNPGDWYYTTTAPMVRLNFDPNATGPTPPASVNEIVNQANFNVYPNPNNGIFNISISNSVENQTIEIKNIIGQIVYSETASNSSINTIDLSDLDKGVYTVSLVSESGISTAKKIIIQ
jgi:hypothetical protein